MIRHCIGQSPLFGLALIGMAVLFSACAQPLPADCDSVSRCAARLNENPHFPTTDSFAADGDEVDWKYVTASRDGKALLDVLIGQSESQNHQVVAHVSVWDVDDMVAPISAVEVVPGTSRYQLTWFAEAGRRYLLRFLADIGKTAYSVSFSLAGQNYPEDPCYGVVCSKTKRCRGGRCVGSSGVVAKDPCAGKVCPSGQRCRRGICRPVWSAQSLASCTPSCDARQRCVRGACRPAKSLSARVKAYHELDDGSLIDLDKGASHGVSEGDTGLLDGEEFVVRDVYRYRCQAWMSGSTDAQASRQAVIYVASDRRTHRASKDGRTSSDDDHSTPPPKAPAGSLRSFTDKKR